MDKLPEELLTTLQAADEAFKGFPENAEAGTDFLVRIRGDDASYQFPGNEGSIRAPPGELRSDGNGGTRSYAVAHVQSERLPGGHCVVQGDSVVNFYCGNGLKKQRAFLLLEAALAPGPIMDEAVEAKEKIQEPIEEIMDDDAAASSEGEGG